jgi:protein TonB
MKGDSTSKNINILDDIPVDPKSKPCEGCENNDTLRITDLTELPVFAGWKPYLKKNLKITPDALDIGLNGKIYVQFTVLKDGSVTDVKIKSGLLKSMDNEVLRVIKNMPAKWEPGKINGHPVNVRLVQPITINVSK